MNELVTVEAPAGKNLLELAEEHGISVFRGIWPELHCQRTMGWCNRCKVWVTGLQPNAINPRTKKEQSRYRLGGAIPPGGNMRLACQVIVQGDCEVRTRAGGPERARDAEWAPDPRDFKWRERWEKRNEEAAEDDEEAPKKKPAAKPAPAAAPAGSAAATAAGGAAAAATETVAAPSKPEPA
jgi:ferredoxin